MKQSIVLVALATLLVSCSSMKKSTITTQKDSLESQTPSLTAPKVRRVWVPAKIEGDKYIDGHYMYVIEKTSSWSN